MASSSSAQNPQCVPGSSSSTTERYKEPSRTLLTPIDSLEVLCKLIIDFESMKENGYDLTPNMEFQGWTRYFNHLLGPVFPKLVKEFWIHSSTSNHQVTSYVMGKKIAISEDLIVRLIGHNDGGIHCSDMEEKCSDLTTISREIFTSGQPSNKIKDLKDYFKIWAKIILGCINHRKPTSSPDYINIDQQFCCTSLQQRQR